MAGLGSLEAASPLEDETARWEGGRRVRRVERTEELRPPVKPVIRIFGAMGED